MKKLVSIILVVACLLCLYACGVSGVLNGTYMSESGKYKVEFRNDGTCTWYQDKAFFYGTYQRKDYGWQLNVNGSGHYVNTVFEARKDGRNLTIYGGAVNNERFIKQ